MKAMFPLALAVLLGACHDTTDAPGAVPEPVSATAVTLPPAPSDDEPDVHLPADRIYYDLTRFPWYAQGEPLRHEGRGYLPTGLPLAASLDEMELAGAYEGVDYYHRREAGDALLFVPVHDGYWLAFRPVGAPPVPAD